MKLPDARSSLRKQSTSLERKQPTSLERKQPISPEKIKKINDKIFHNSPKDTLFQNSINSSLTSSLGSQKSKPLKPKKFTLKELKKYTDKKYDSKIVNSKMKPIFKGQYIKQNNTRKKEEKKKCKMAEEIKNFSPDRLKAPDSFDWSTTPIFQQFHKNKE